MCGGGGRLRRGGAVGGEAGQVDGGAICAEVRIPILQSCNIFGKKLSLRVSAKHSYNQLFILEKQILFPKQCMDLRRRTQEAAS